MPQKRNPGLLNRTRVSASSAMTLALGPAIQMHNITPGMSDPKSVKANSEMVNSGIKALKNWQAVIKALVVDPKRSLEELNSDWTASQELADELMLKHKLPFRIGHHFASEIVSYARKHDIKPLDFPYAEAQRIYAEAVHGQNYPQQLPMSEADFRAALDPVAIVKRRATAGGPQPAEMEKMLASARQDLDAQQAWIDAHRQKIDDSLKQLDSDFAKLLSSTPAAVDGKTAEPAQQAPASTGASQ